MRTGRIALRRSTAWLISRITCCEWFACPVIRTRMRSHSSMAFTNCSANSLPFGMSRGAIQQDGPPDSRYTARCSVSRASCEKWLIKMPRRFSVSFSTMLHVPIGNRSKRCYLSGICNAAVVLPNNFLTIQIKTGAPHQSPCRVIFIGHT